MRFIIPTLSPVLRNSPSSLVMQGSAIIAAVLLGSGLVCAKASAQSPAPQAAQKPAQHSHSPRKNVKPAPTASVPETPPPPPQPNWPANDRPGRAAVTLDSHGLHIEASNSSLHQILSDVSVQTGTKVEGMGADQRVYGSYGPGQPREVLAQLLQGSGYNVLLAGDLGSGAPRQLVLSPRNGAASPASAGATPQSSNPDDDIPDNEVEEQPPPPPPQQPIPMQANPNPARPGFGPNGPIRTPQQVMEEMQRQQLLQQQQQQQQQESQPNNPPE